MKRKLGEEKWEMETVTNKNTTLEGKFSEENVVLIDDMMTMAQYLFEKANQDIVFLNLGVDMKLE